MKGCRLILELGLKSRDVNGNPNVTTEASSAPEHICTGGFSVSSIMEAPERYRP